MHADLFLEGGDGLDRIAAAAPVDAVRLEAMLVEPALDFLDLGEGGDALTAGELPVERRIAADQVAKMDEGEAVGGGRVIGMDRAEIHSDQEGRAAALRQPQ